MKSIYLFTGLFALISCSETFQEEEVVKSKRILIKESAHSMTYSVAIVRVDSTEYLMSSQGGICPLQK